MRKITLFLVLLCWTSLSAKNYYVAKDGLDTNNGSKDAPFLTIAKISSVLRAGDTCFIMEGTYRETLQPKNSGTSSAPIVYTRYQDDEVIISATEKLDNWQVHSGNIYKANYTMNLGRLNALFCDSKCMDFARWPNNTDDNLLTVDMHPTVTGGSASTIQTSGIPGNWVGGYVCYLGAHSGMTWTRQITASTANLISYTAIDIAKWPFNPHNPTVYRNGNRGRFYLMGTLEAIDYEREWFHENGIVYFQAPGNGNPNDLNVEIRARKSAAILDKSYIHIVGLNTFGGNIEIKASNCLLKNNVIKEGWRCRDELNNTTAQVSEGAINIMAPNITIDHNTIDGSSLNGIMTASWGNPAPSNIKITNNYIHNCNTIGLHASPVRNNAKNTLIWGNTIHTTGRDGIYSSATNCEIAYNDVYDVMHINNDGGVFYTVGNDNEKNVKIHHNWFHDSKGPTYADGRCAGIYLDNDSKGYVVHHNVVWNVTWSGIQLNWDNWNIDIYNNTLYQMEAALDRWANGRFLDDIVLRNNYSNAGPWPSPTNKEWLSKETGTPISINNSNLINARPNFENWQNKDFRPSENSILINGGEIIEGITDGYFGNKPDIGAYEYGVTPWRPGVDPVISGDIETGIEEKDEVSTFIFPNPLVNSNLNIKLEQNAEVKIYSLNSQLVYAKNCNEGLQSIDYSVFPTKGLYLVQINCNNDSKSIKVMVN